MGEGFGSRVKRFRGLRDGDSWMIYRPGRVVRQRKSDSLRFSLRALLLWFQHSQRGSLPSIFLYTKRGTIHHPPRDVDRVQSWPAIAAIARNVLGLKVCFLEK